eukprot:6136158-Pleurochrysis_carterae.AAC.2
MHVRHAAVAGHHATSAGIVLSSSCRTHVCCPFLSPCLPPRSFEATWWGVQLGVLHHHDSTRIHFDDFGRIFLAQLTLNALPLLTAMERDDAPSLQSRIGARHHLSNVGSIGLLELQKQPF